MTEGEARKQYGHDLVQLRNAARERELAIEAELPYWLQIISFFHTAPYQYRYPPDGMTSAIPRGNLFAVMLLRRVEYQQAGCGPANLGKSARGGSSYRTTA